MADENWDMPRLVRTLASVIPWILHVMYAGWWGIAGYAAGFPFILVLAVLWTGLLVVFRKVVTTETRRLKRLLLDAIWLAVAFLFGWEGGIAVLPALVSFFLADLVDPTTPPFPVRVPRRLVIVVLGVAALVLLPIALTAPLYESATSGPVSPGATAGPDLVTTTRLLDLVAQPAPVAVLAVLSLSVAVAAAVLRRRRAQVPSRPTDGSAL